MSEPDKNGKQKLIKKDIQQRVILDTDKIVPFEYINDRGNVVKKKCTIKVDNTEYHVLLYPYEKLKKLRLPIEVKGFIKCIKE